MAPGHDADQRDPLWRKAPLLMLRFPGLLAALATGALLLALTSASLPVFVSASASAALSERIEEVNRFGAGITVLQNGHFVVPRLFERRYEEFVGHPFEEHTGVELSENAPPTWEQRAARLAQETHAIPNLAPVITTVIGPELEVSLDPDGAATPVRLISRSGWEDHVRTVSGHGEGLWLADTVAEPLGIRAGDEVVLSNGERSVRLRVAGVYEALVQRAIPAPYWSSLANDIYPSALGFAEPPAFAFLPFDEQAGVARDLRENAARFQWEQPLAHSETLTLPRARRIEAAFDDLRARFTRSSALSRFFVCTGFCLTSSRLVNFGSFLEQTVAETERTIEAVEGPVDLLADAGALVAMAVIASAGAFSVARRSTETQLLAAKGAGAGWFGAKSALEAVLPALLGGALGGALAVAAVELFGPGAVATEARGAAIAATALSVPITVALVGASAAISFLRSSEMGSSRLRALGAFPWEVLPLLGAGLCLRMIASGEALVAGERAVERPSIYLLLFPILLLAALGGVGARALRALLQRMAKGAPRLGSALYLALRRLGGARRLAVVLVTACALALGLLAYAQTVAASLEATVDAKAQVFVGSDMQAQVPPTQEVPELFPYPATKVTTVPERAEFAEGGAAVDILAVDAETFEEAAYWDPSFSDQDLGDMLAALDPLGDRVPVILVGSEAEPSVLRVGGADMTLSVVGHARSFPGVSEGHPAVVSTRDAIDAYFEQAAGANPLVTGVNTTALWIEGDPRAVAEAAARVDLQLGFPVTAEEVGQNPSIVAVTRTFRYLKLLGAGAGALASVAILMYLQARQRARIVSYALSRRMGLRRSSHRAAVVAELAWLLLGAFAISAGLALGVARVVLPYIEPLPNITPEMIFVIPWPLLATIGLTLAAAAVGGGLVADRTTERADFAEVMRVGV